MSQPAIWYLDFVIGLRNIRNSRLLYLYLQQSSKLSSQVKQKKEINISELISRIL